jgi:hypothetical protein
MSVDKRLETINMEPQEALVKRKKGRPRKVDVEQSLSVVQEKKPVEEKKKRGRKKKEVVVEEIKQKKKRGRKAAVKYFSSSIRKKIPLTAVIQNNSNFILHLDVKDEDEGGDNTCVTYETVKEKLFSSTNLKTNGNSSDDSSNIVDSVFEKLKNEEINNEIDNESLLDVKKEIEQLLDNDKNILSDFLDNDYHESDLRDLYEQRIKFRENQDKLLVKRFENIQKDDEAIQNLIQKEIKLSKEHNVEQSSDEKQQELNRKKGFFEILYKFVHNPDWLHTTDVSCWWCCHEFDSVPIGLPVDFYARSKKFRVKGIFCGFACMMAFKNDSTKYDKKDALIKYMYKLLTGESNYNSNIKPAPTRWCLKKFGGDLTIEEFRNASKNHSIYKMVEYPMFVSKDFVEEVDVQNVKNANNKLFSDMIIMRTVNLDERRIEDARVRLSQIEKSTVMTGNTIDKFIKFN